MKILGIDCESNLLDLLMRCQQWGHEVVWWDRQRDNGQDRRAGEGIVPKLRDFEQLRKKWIGWADLILCADNAHYIDLLEPFREIGYPIIGASKETAAWELDRSVGQRVMRECGLKIIEGREFHDYDAAIAWVKKQGRAFVSKPSGDADKALSYVATGPDDLCYMLRRWKENDKYRKDAAEHGFILQEKKDGCEMAVGGWFGPGGWNAPIMENFEYKKLMDGSLGPNTGEQGTLARYVTKSRLFDATLAKVTKHLKEAQYVGYVDINGSIDAKGEYWPFEFTMRFGWPLTHNQVALHEGDPIKWMADLANGYDTMKVSDDVSVSVVVAIPDYPYSRYTGKQIEGIPLYNCTDTERIHLSEVMMGEAPVAVGGKVVELPCYVSAGDYLLVAVGRGETITGARRSVYKALEKIRIPSSPFWRRDIGRDKLVEQLPKIQKLGFAKGLSY